MPLTAEVLDGRRAAAMAGPPRSSRPARARRLPGLHRARRHALLTAAEGRRMSRREAWLTALGIFVVALAVRAVAAGPIGLPRAGGHRLLRGGRAQPGRGPRPGLRCAVVVRHAAAGVPAPRVRGLAAAAVAAVRDPASRSPGPPRPSRSRRAMRAVAGGERCCSAPCSPSSPGDWLPTSPRSAALGIGAGADARHRERPGHGRLPAAGPALGPAGLHDAVRRARPGCRPADGPGAARSAWRTARGPAPAWRWGCSWARPR